MSQVPARNHKKDVFYEVLCYTMVSDESHKKGMLERHPYWGLPNYG